MAASCVSRRLRTTIPAPVVAQIMQKPGAVDLHE
jgi:hypothetical protein